MHISCSRAPRPSSATRPSAGPCSQGSSGGVWGGSLLLLAGLSLVSLSVEWGHHGAYLAGLQGLTRVTERAECWALWPVPAGVGVTQLSL